VIIHDPVTRDRFWTEAGETCGIFGHKIQNTQAFLERNEGYTKAVGWMAGITKLPEIMIEVTKAEFLDVFAVVKVLKDKVPDLAFSPDFENLHDEDLRFANKFHKEWLVLLAWTAWCFSGDQERTIEDRAWWWGLLNKLCNEVFSQAPPRTGSPKADVRFVLPAGLMEHPLRLDKNGRSHTDWHQLVMLAPTNLTAKDLCSAKAVHGVRSFLANDPTPLMFDQEHRHKLQAVPMEPTQAPFFLNTVNPHCWSVVASMRKCRKEACNDIATKELLEATFENLAKTFRAHLVEQEIARRHAFEIAIAAVVAATDRGINDQEMERLLTDYDITGFDVTRAKAWLDPLAEAVE
jgi:hypothetical protein